MAQKETLVQKIVRLTALQFPSFGNSLSFAGEVKIEEVVRFVLAKKNAKERIRQKKIGNDARDIQYASWLLGTLSSKALRAIQQLTQHEIRQRLKHKKAPFSRLSRKARETLPHLPASWLYEGARWQLNIRKSDRLHSVRKK